MRIVKHIENERLSGAGSFAHGWLTGLIASEHKKLEVTNCFPTARTQAISDDDKALQDIEDGLFLHTFSVCALRLWTIIAC